MMGQNSFSNTYINSNANNSATNSVPPSSPAPLSSEPNKPKKKLSAKTIILIIVSALIGAGITVAIFLLFINRPPKAVNISNVDNASLDNDGTKTIEETIASFDDKINSSADKSEQLSLKLNKADYYMISDNPDAAISTLNAIDLDSLDGDDKYIIYTKYADIYTAKGDNTQAEHYQKLANDALDQTYAGDEDEYLYEDDEEESEEEE